MNRAKNSVLKKDEMPMAREERAIIYARASWMLLLYQTDEVFRAW